MVDTKQQYSEQLVTIARALLRRRWQAMGIAWVIVLVGWIAVDISVNPSYTANAKLYIHTETVLSPLLKGLAVEVNRQAQLGLMTRLVMSRPNLERVVRQTGLDRQGRHPPPLGVAVERLRKDLSLQALRIDRTTKFSNFYVITYTNTNPELAEQVVHSLIDAFSANTLAESRKDSARAQSFIDQQIAEYRERVTNSERRLREYKHHNVNILPRGKQSYYDRLQAEQAKLEGVALGIQQAESQRAELKSKLAATPAVTRALSPGGNQFMTPLESRLAALETKLDGLLLKYTEEHPDVIETRSSIRELRQQLKGGRHSLPTMPNPVYSQLELRLQDVVTKLAGLRAEQKAYRLRVEKLEKQIQTLPPVEDELQRLTRDYEQDEKNLEDLVARRQSMEVSENASLDSEDLEVRVVDPPNVEKEVALQHIRKKRIVLESAVLLAGIFGGLGLAFGMEQLRPGIYSQGVLSRVTGLPVYGVISRVATANSTGVRQRLELFGFLAASSLLLLAYAAVLLLEFGNVRGLTSTVAYWVGPLFGGLG